MKSKPLYNFLISGTILWMIAIVQYAAASTPASINTVAYENQSIQISPDANNILYVNIAVTGGTGDGSSWENAMPELADALKYVRIQYNADTTVYDTTPLQIYVAKGTYKPLYNAADSSYTTDGGRDNAFVMVKNVQIYGGFDPDNNITDLTHHRILPDNNATVGRTLSTVEGTILSGDIGTITDNTDNAYHVVISSEDVGSALLDGFTITHGNANDTNNSSSNIKVNGGVIYRYYGGGMYSRSSSPVLTHISITDNTTDFFGGGMFNNSSSPVLTHVNIINNKARFGGGMFNNSSTPVLTYVNIINNKARYGGGMTNYSSSPPVLTNVNITDNTAGENGGGMYSEYSSPVLINVNITNNKARFGGGMYNYSSSPQVYNSIVYGNTKTNGNAADNVDKNNNNSTPEFYNSLIEGSRGSTAWVASFGTDGGHNIDATTLLFTDAANGDYSLAPGSPAIDAGDKQYWINQMGALTGNVTDLAGNPRIVGSSIDMGVYEAQPIPITPDANNIIYVNTAVTGGTGDGSSWANAMPELADALKYARMQYDADNTAYDATPLQIYVAKGTYKPMYSPIDGDDFGTPTDPRDVTFLLVKNVQIYGGFDPAKNITDLTHNRILPDENTSVVDGTILSGDIGTPNDISDNAYHIVISSEDVGNATLNGVAITHGNADGASSSIKVNGGTIYRYRGGGIHNYYSDPVLTNISITSNSANSGGGMSNLYSYPALTNISITSNTAGSGGGIFNEISSPKLTYVNFRNNTANFSGGGIVNQIITLFNYTPSSPILKHVNFTGNSAEYGGAIYNYSRTLS